MKPAINTTTPQDLLAFQHASKIDQLVGQYISQGMDLKDAYDKAIKQTS
jgi:hypothetical protein